MAGEQNTIIFREDKTKLLHQYWPRGMDASCAQESLHSPNCPFICYFFPRRALLQVHKYNFLMGHLMMQFLF